MARAIRDKNLFQKIKGLLHNFKIIAFLSFFAIGIGATLLMTQQSQDNRQDAASRPSWRDTYNPFRPTSGPTPTPTPVKGAIPQVPTPASCRPGAYLGGTYCVSQTSCYDIYCNASGTGSYATFLPSSSCSHCTVKPTTAPTSVPKICNPNQYVGGTYCTGPTSCYDKYCDSTGTTTRNVVYSGSQCSHCAGPTPAPTTPPSVCTPNGYLGGTYCESKTRCYDIYCNSSGTGSNRTYYSGTTCAHCANY